VVLCDRPAHLALDEQGRLHSEAGSAVEYPDGWAIWAWHGVRVPRHVIEEPGSLKALEVVAAQDVEVRRVMIERMGIKSFLREAGGFRVARDEVGVLWRLDLPDDEALVCVELTDSTASADQTFRQHMLRVPPEVRSPHEAVAWSFELEIHEYRPTAES
jgi:hypothetical protein